MGLSLPFSYLFTLPCVVSLYFCYLVNSPIIMIYYTFLCLIEGKCLEKGQWPLCCPFRCQKSQTQSLQEKFGWCYYSKEMLLLPVVTNPPANHCYIMMLQNCWRTVDTTVPLTTLVYIIVDLSFDSCIKVVFSL